MDIEDNIAFERGTDRGETFNRRKKARGKDRKKGTKGGVM